MKGAGGSAERLRVTAGTGCWLLMGLLLTISTLPPDQPWGPAGQGDGNVSSTSATALGLELSPGLGLASAMVEKLGLRGPPGQPFPTCRSPQQWSLGLGPPSVELPSLANPLLVPVPLVWLEPGIQPSSFCSLQAPTALPYVQERLGSSGVAVD